VITQLPFVVSIYYSFTNLKDKTQSLIPEPTRFVGLDNYSRSSAIRSSARRCGRACKMTVLAVLLVADHRDRCFAVLLDRAFFGQGLIRTLLITPFLLMPVVAALIWKQQMFSSLFGVLNKVLTFLGFNSVQFISDHPLGSIVHGARLAVDAVHDVDHPRRAAEPAAGRSSKRRTSTARAQFGIFRQLTLPHLRRYLELGALLGSIYIVQAFDAIDVMTGGGPGSTNVPYYVYQESIGGGFR
jgi:sorbitol/mannitol transport system permease protein